MVEISDSGWQGRVNRFTRRIDASPVKKVRVRKKGEPTIADQMKQLGIDGIGSSKTLDPKEHKNVKIHRIKKRGGKVQKYANDDEQFGDTGAREGKHDADSE